MVSQKGGVGKTTITVNLAYSLARRGWKVLVADADLQGGVGFSLTEKAKSATGYFDLIASDGEDSVEKWQESVMHTNLPELDLLTRGSRESLDEIMRNAGTLPGIEQRIRKLNEALEDGGYDLVIYDTQTGIGPVTLGICSVVNHIVVPERPEPLCLRTLPEILRMIASVKASSGEDDEPKLAGFVLALADPEDPSNLGDQREFRDLLPGDLVFETVIPDHRDFREASRAGVPVAMLRERPSPSSLVFDQLAAELEGRIQLYDDPVSVGNEKEEYARLVD